MASTTHQSPSPSYQSPLTFADSDRDVPGRRCGHTLTSVNANGSHQLVLFGGCTTSVSGLDSTTNAVHCFDVLTSKWKRINPAGEVPTSRAGHAAISMGPVVLVQGGICPVGLVSGDVYMLDMSTNVFNWKRLKIGGVAAPCPRYGHVMGLVNQRWIVIFGGNNGVEDEVLSDTWALDTYRPLVWERLYPSGLHQPCGRMYASACAREDDIVLICGGRDNFGLPLRDAYKLKVDPNIGQWVWLPVPGIAPFPRYQHTAVFQGSDMHVIGGIRNKNRLIDGDAVVSVLDSDINEWLERRPDEISMNDKYRQYQNQLMRRCRHAAAVVGTRIYIYGGLRKGVLLSDLVVADTSSPSSSELFTPSSSSSSEPITPSLMTRSSSESSLETLGEEHSLSAVETVYYDSEFEENTPLQEKLTQELVNKVISTLLKPNDWKPPANRKFFLSYFEVDYLCRAVEQIFKKEETVLKLKVPIKIFGDLHGQFEDLMRIFREYGSPSTQGDITHIDYLFLGDYVDRGRHSLETIVLLFALKIEYPENIYLIRGNHESGDINTVYGFIAECRERLGKEDGDQAWFMFNTIFDHLPLAAVIEDKVLCVHGGIGRTNLVQDIEKIQRPVFPESSESEVLKDTLWSDPAGNDTITGITPNARGEQVVTFGADVVKEFCKRNGLDLIVRAHECVMDGFERFADGKLITVFSATNYCGHIRNAGAILVIGRDMVVYPKLIHPNPPPILSSSQDSPDIERMQELSINGPPNLLDRGKSIA